MHQRKNLKQAMNQGNEPEEEDMDMVDGSDVFLSAGTGTTIEMNIGQSTASASTSSASNTDKRNKEEMAKSEKKNKKKKISSGTKNNGGETKVEPEVEEEIDITGMEKQQRKSPGSGRSSSSKAKANTTQGRGDNCCSGGICGVPSYDENDKGIKWLPLFFLAIFVMPIFIAIGDWLSQQEFMKPYMPAPNYEFCLNSYFKEVNPSRMDKVSQFLEDYRGREDKLFRKLERKYGVRVPCKFQG